MFPEEFLGISSGNSSYRNYLSLFSAIVESMYICQCQVVIIFKRKNTLNIYFRGPKISMRASLAKVIIFLIFFLKYMQ